MKKELEQKLKAEDENRKLWAQENVEVERLKEELRICTNKFDVLVEELAQAKAERLSKADSK